MLAWSEGTDNGRQKTEEIMVMTSLWAETIYWLSDHLANLSR